MSRYKTSLDGTWTCSLCGQEGITSREDHDRLVDGHGYVTKPPLGVIPQWLWEEQRMTALTDAIERYLDEGKTPLPEWYSELLNLVAKAVERRK